MNKILTKLDEKDEQVISRGFRDKMESLLETYDVSVQEDTEEQREMKNYLDRTNSSMRREIVDFIKKFNLSIMDILVSIFFLHLISKYIFLIIYIHYF